MTLKKKIDEGYWLSLRAEIQNQKNIQNENIANQSSA
jgi:hypothetical protein